MEIIGRSHLENHLKALADNGLISPQEVREVAQRLKKEYVESEDRSATSKDDEITRKIPSYLLQHFYAANYIKNAIQRKIDEANLVINTFVELWNNGQIGDEESRIAIENAVKRKKQLEKLLEVAQQRNKLEFENHIDNIESLCKEINEIDKQEDQVEEKERSEAIRASISKSLEFLTKKNAEYDSFIQQFDKLILSSQNRIINVKTDSQHSWITTKRLESLIEAVRGQYQTIHNILTSRNQFEFETVLAKEIFPEEHERELLASLVVQLEDAGKIPIHFNQEHAMAELISGLSENEAASDEQPEDAPGIFSESEALESQQPSIESEPEENSDSLSKNETLSEVSPPKESIQEDMVEETIGPWSFVGNILLSSDNQPIGVCAEPLVTPNGEVYLKCIKEEDVGLEESDQIFREMSMILKGASDSSIARKEVLRQEITETLKIPSQLALRPTFVREYFGSKHVVALKLPIDLDLAVKSIEYYRYDSLAANDAPGIAKLVSGSGTKDLEGTLAPSSWNWDMPEQGAAIKRFDGENLGVVRNLFKTSSFGTYVVVEFDKPSLDLCTEIHQHTGGSADFSKGPGIWSLRFLIARRLDGVFEGEALLYWNVWKFLYEEKVPILPWDLRMDYIGLVPAGAVVGIENSEISLKRRIEPHAISNTIPLLENSTVFLNSRNIGRLVGYDLDDNGIPSILVSCKSTKEILAGIGRDTSDDYVRRLGARISKALGIPADLAMSPGAIARYLLFFVRLVDVPTFTGAMNWLKEHLGLQSFNLGQIEKATDTGIYIVSED
ncbi:MAG: hypothetical protein ACXACI_02610 [Candidatus Hodarchaeales archaeon]|jgi:hypothetical protein